MDEGLRVGDRDREQVAETLREQYAQGRLTMEELDERSAAAYSAKTLGELRALTADLPAEPEEQPPSRATVAWIAAAGALLTVALVVAVVILGHAAFAWPSWLVALVIMKAVRGRCAPARRSRAPVSARTWHPR